MVDLNKMVNPEDATVWYRCNLCFGWLHSISALKQHGETNHGKNQDKIILPRKVYSNDEDDKIYTTYDTPCHQDPLPPPLPYSLIKTTNHYYPSLNPSEEESETEEIRSLISTVDECTDPTVPDNRNEVIFGESLSEEPNDSPIDSCKKPTARKLFCASSDSGIQRSIDGSRDGDDNSGLSSPVSSTLNEELQLFIPPAKSQTEIKTVETSTKKFDCTDTECSRTFRSISSRNFHVWNFHTKKNAGTPSNISASISDVGLNQQKLRLTIATDKTGNLRSWIPGSDSAKQRDPSSGAEKSSDSSGPSSPVGSDVGSQVSTVFLERRQQVSAAVVSTPSDIPSGSRSRITSSESDNEETVTSSNGLVKQLPHRDSESLPQTSAPSVVSSNHSSDSSDDWNATAPPKKKLKKRIVSSPEDSDAKTKCSPSPKKHPRRSIARKSMREQTPDSSASSVRTTRSSLRRLKSPTASTSSSVKDGNASERSSRSSTKSTTKKATNDDSESDSSFYDSDELFEEIKTTKKKKSKTSSSTVSSTVKTPSNSKQTKTQSTSSKTSSAKAKCKFCPQEFDSSKSLPSHYLSVHPEDELSVTCGICNVGFTVGFAKFNAHLAMCAKRVKSKKK